jgi:hypothetical protein
MGPGAAAAVLDVGEEHVPDEPAPAGSTGARLAGVRGAQRQALLIARRGSGLEHARLGRVSPSDFGAHGVMTRQHAEVAHQVQARRRHRRAEPDQLAPRQSDWSRGTNRIVGPADHCCALACVEAMRLDRAIGAVNTEIPGEVVRDFALKSGSDHVNATHGGDGGAADRSRHVRCRQQAAARKLGQLTDELQATSD